MRGDPVRIIKRFLAALTLAGVAAVVVLAPGGAGSTHSLVGTGVASVIADPRLDGVGRRRLLANP